MKALSTTKIISVMLVLCALSVFAGTAQAATAFSDGFESGAFTGGGWTTAGSPTVTTAAKYTGTYGAQIPGSASTAYIRKSSTVGYNTIHVHYDRKVTNATASNITLTVDWSADGSTYTTLETVSGSTAWATQDYNLPASADNNTNFRLRFRTTAGTSSYYAYVDNVQITAGSVVSATLPWTDGFESGSFTTPGNWNVQSVWPLVDTASKYTGTYGAGIYMTTTGIEKAISTVGYNTIHVKYNRKTNQSTTETFYVDWSTDGSTWTNLETQTGTTSWTSRDYTCGSGANNNAGFRVRFRNNSSGGTTNDNAFVDDVNITGTVPQYTISGTVTYSGSGLAGVTMSGLTGNPVTDSNGNYSATVSSGWSGTVTPSKAGYTFTPPSVTYTNVTSDQLNQNYTAALATYTISGNAGVSGATMNGLPSTPVSGADGNYSGTVDYNWSGMVTPSKTGYTFSPASKTYTNVTSDQLNQNYTAALATYIISGNAGVSGATMNGLPSTPVSGADGNYSGTVDYNWSGTVTPSKTGYTFGPASKTYTNVASDQLSQNYTATLLKYTISGNAGVAGVTMNGLPNTPVSGPSGDYNDTVDYGWSGTVTPAKTGYTFDPNSRTYTSVTSDQLNENYTATLLKYTISGNAGVAGVTMNGLPNTPVSGPSGDYNDTVDYGWSGTVTPAKTGYTFDPNSRTYTSVTSDQLSENYTATLLKYTISGNAGAAGVTMNGLPNTPVSDADGNYSDTVDYNWTGTVTPAKAGYTFGPASRDYSNVTSDQLNQDYTATLNAYIISGHIENECNEPIEGVLVDANNGGGEDTTDVNGFYKVGVDYNWSGTVTPSKAHYTFEPNQMSYVGVIADQPDQNYVAHNIYDLDYDCYIGWGDVAVIHGNWLQTGEDVPGDFYKDGDNIVNFLDFADFALVWQADE